MTNRVPAAGAAAAPSAMALIEAGMGPGVRVDVRRMNKEARLDRVAGDSKMSLPVEFGACSHVGRVRMRNEDVLEVRRDRCWAVLSDGMGGYRGGEEAARIAVSAVLRRFEYEADAGRMSSPEETSECVASAVADANGEILRAGRATPELAGMGATLVAAVFLPGVVVVGHIGDSRLYRLRAGALEQLTRDHTILQEQVDAGMMRAEDARRSRYRSILTRGLGVDALAVPDVAAHAAAVGDAFLICSDGLTDMLSDGEIAAAMQVGGPLPALAERLVEFANLQGGLDNVSVILARIARDTDAQAGGARAA